ncbi:MAG: hypothetical protein ABI688_04730, partial [Bacteroidota bacterium]
MKNVATILLITSVFLFSCKQEKKAGESNTDQPAIKTIDSNRSDKNMQAVLDSIKGYKPIKLSINEEHSDVDELIPLGYNNHGSFAYLINENSGGSSGMHFGVLPAYEDFSLASRPLCARFPR